MMQNEKKVSWKTYMRYLLQLALEEAEKFRKDLEDEKDIDDNYAVSENLESALRCLK